MYFIDKLKNEYGNKKMDIFVDMDGVIAEYELNKPLDFKNKRPLYSNINVLRELSLIDNFTLHILSICKRNYQIEEKNEWLDNYAPFFKKENRVIISKESSPLFSSKELKCNYLKQINDKEIMVIDDDNGILKYLHEEIKDIILFQDSSLID